MEAVLEMRQERTRLVNEAKAIVDNAIKGKRKLTYSEESEYNQIIDQIRANREQETRFIEIHGLQDGSSVNHEPIKGDPSDSGYLKDNSEIRCYRHGEERRLVSDIASKGRLPSGVRHEDLSLGRAIRAMITGNWKDAELEARAMATSPGSSGGYLVPETLSANVIGMALNQMRVQQAGAIFTPMGTQVLMVPKILTMPTAEWLGENAEGSFGDLSFGQVTLTAKKVMVLLSMSLELAEDGLNVHQTIEGALAEAMALEFDRVALCGDSGDGEPVGILNTEGIGSIGPWGGRLTDYSLFSDAWTTIIHENETPTALIMPPALFGQLDALTDTLGQPIMPPQSWSKYKQFDSNQIPASEETGYTTAIMGDFRKLLWGIRTQLQIEVTRTADEAFKKGQVWIRGYLRGDVAVTRPAAFCELTGISAIEAGS